MKTILITLTVLLFGAGGCLKLRTQLASQQKTSNPVVAHSGQSHPNRANGISTRIQ